MAARIVWLTTEEAADQVGMTSEWVRHQIMSRRLPATVWDFGGRRTYRIRSVDWLEFVARFSHATKDPDWE